MRQDKGFTLVEILVTVGVLGIVLLTSYSLFVSQSQRIGDTNFELQMLNLMQEELNLVDSILETEPLEVDQCYIRRFNRIFEIQSESMVKRPTSQACDASTDGEGIVSTWEVQAPKDLVAEFDYPESMKLPEDQSGWIQIRVSVYDPARMQSPRSILILREQPLVE